jgi:hypothetical protein
MNIETLQDVVCIEASCVDDRDDLSKAIKCLLSEAYTKEIVPSFIDFNLITPDELSLTLYGYPRSIFHLA